MDHAIRVENLGKEYQLGLTHAGTFRRGFARLTGRKPKPSLDGPDISEADSRSGRVRDGKFWAVRDLNFDVQPGEVVGFVGRNGAGKSTLLKILSRITTPTTGMVEYRGRVGSLLEVGTGFHPELTGRENIYLNGTILGMQRSEVREKLEDITRFAEVDSFLDTPVKRYSSGMRVRLGFAVAAHLEPDILIVDEVLAVGDAGFQDKCLGKMSEMASHGRTVLFVSHNMAAIQNLCSRVIVLEGGRVTQDGENIDSIISTYLKTFSLPTDSDLYEAPREQGYRPLISGLEFLNGEGERVDAARAGEPLTIRIHYRSEDTIDNIGFGLAIEHMLGVRVFWLQSRIQHDGRLGDLSGQGYVDCHIPDLRLLPGRYHITVACNRRGVDLDLLNRAKQLSVTEGDVFGTGKLPPPAKCLTYTPTTWTLTPS